MNYWKSNRKSLNVYLRIQKENSIAIIQFNIACSKVNEGQSLVFGFSGRFFDRNWCNKICLSPLTIFWIFSDLTFQSFDISPSSGWRQSVLSWIARYQIWSCGPLFVTCLQVYWLLAESCNKAKLVSRSGFMSFSVKRLTKLND